MRNHSCLSLVHAVVPATVRVTDLRNAEQLQMCYARVFYLFRRA